MNTLLLIAASVVCTAIVVVYGLAFLHLILTNKGALAVGAVMVLGLLVFAALF